MSHCSAPRYEEYIVSCQGAAAAGAAAPSFTTTVPATLGPARHGHHVISRGGCSHPMGRPPGQPGRTGRGPGAGARRRLWPNQERIRKRCIMLSYVSLRVVSISLPCLKYIRYALCQSAYLCLKYILPHADENCILLRAGAWRRVGIFSLV